MGITMRELVSRVEQGDLKAVYHDGLPFVRPAVVRRLRVRHG